MRKKVAAILCSDVHLSLTPPVWRSDEPNWFKAMARPLKELDRLAKHFDCPVLCAGDVFDRWNPSPELINFALKHMPRNFWSVPGQHDLPYHNYENMEKSAYWTLVRAGCIHYLHPTVPNQVGDVWNKVLAFGHPFGFKVEPLGPHKEDNIHIAILHEYNWIKDKSYPRANPTSKLTGKRTNFKGWDVVCIGDNHKGFMKKIGNTTFFNCGTLMRRKSDEADYKPWIGLVTEDKEVIPHYLDTSKDVCIAPSTTSDEGLGINDQDMEALFKQLETLGKDALNFAAAIKHFLHKHGEKKAVRRLIKKAMEM